MQANASAWAASESCEPQAIANSSSQSGQDPAKLVEIHISASDIVETASVRMLSALQWTQTRGGASDISTAFGLPLIRFKVRFCTLPGRCSGHVACFRS